MDDFKLIRGHVYLAELEAGKGSKQRGTRPVVIIQNNLGNHFAPITIVAAITSKKKDKNLPTHMQVLKGTANLLEDSTVLFEQIQTISKECLRKKIGELPVHLHNDMNEKIKISLGIIEFDTYNGSNSAKRHA
ncbi:MULTISPECIES: type II toxin-antitoxin system PemK/MazF family toxin [unclassified Psychrobacillus]|uniref:type II toxin-antitoxin system PemK/MazF family toxin n=1 Tax=unclassified Psychrobacillus TaxID=2636677 RepID=UPI0030F7340B